MRIRTIKPEFFTHEGIFEAEMETKLPLRLAFIGLWCAADREGRFKWEPRRLGVSILPYDSKDFSRVLDALASRGFVVKYCVNGESFGCIPSFSRHQVINNRESESVIPQMPENQDEETRAAREDDASPTREARQKAEGKEGREGERKGKDACASVDFPECLSTLAFQAAWQNWTLYRRERKLPALTPTGIRAQLKKLAGWGERAAIASINESISQNWQGLFEPKGDAAKTLFDQDHSRNPLVDTSQLERSGVMVKLTDRDI